MEISSNPRKIKHNNKELYRIKTQTNQWISKKENGGKTQKESTEYREREKALMELGF